VREGNTMTSRHWCFTSFLNEINLQEDNELLKYAIYGKETCPKSKRHHYQGYIEFIAPIRMKQAKEVLGDEKAHLEIRKGTQSEAITYCKKEHDYTEFGNKYTEQGKRTDLDKVVEDIKLGAKLSDVALANPKPFIKFHNGITKLWNIHQAQTLEEKDIIVLIGKPGTGKTRYIYDHHPIEDIYRKPPGMWWDGYEGQPIVLLDDIDTNQYTISEFLQWFDRYPISVPIKGGFAKLTCKKIYITSNKPIIEWFHNITSDHIQALQRRITTIVNLPKLDPLS
jgi:hypothetical protein